MSQTSLLQKVRYSFELVKFSHSLFALPFALSAFLVTSRGQFAWSLLLWVIIAVVCARTAAMGFNRWIDASFDAQNPRTQSRHIPAGLLSRSYVLGFTLFFSAGFIFSASQINRLSFLLSPFCLAILFFYSLTKRFTFLTQIFLGLALGIAPVGAAIAVSGKIVTSSLILGLGVLFWVAGFDLLYSLQDLDFDRQVGLHSIPAKVGEKKTRKLAILFHGLFLASLFFYGNLENLGTVYRWGLVPIGAFLFWQHWLIREDLRKIDAAFFTVNGFLSLGFLIIVVISVYF